jgi:hypothetical protein
MEMAMKDRKKLIIGVVAGGLTVGAAALVIGAGIAKADVYGSEGDQSLTAYVSELYPDGVYLSVPQARDIAMKVCWDRQMGFPRQRMIDDGEQEYSVKFAVDSVMGAEFHFCPAYDAIHMPDVPVLPPPSVPGLTA